MDKSPSPKLSEKNIQIINNSILGGLINFKRKRIDPDEYRLSLDFKGLGENTELYH